MIASAQAKLRRCSIRLAIGAALDVLLLVMLPRLAMWSSEERAVGMAMGYAVAGAAAMVCVAPVLRRGTEVQRVGAVMVIVVSALAFWPAVDYWLGMRGLGWRPLSARAKHTRLAHGREAVETAVRSGAASHRVDGFSLPPRVALEPTPRQVVPKVGRSVSKRRSQPLADEEAQGRIQSLDPFAARWGQRALPPRYR